jgi:hypothetical protein
MKSLHKLPLILVLFFSTQNIFAKEKQISCTAEASEILTNGQRVSETLQLDIIDQSEIYISLSVDLKGFNFSFSGDKKGNSFYVSITQLPNYDQGALTTTAFSADGRLQLSIVNKEVVHKLECFNR